MTCATGATADSATSKQAAAEGVPRDILFRSTKGKVVGAPVFSTPIADTHAHLDMLESPGFTLARCAANGVGFIATVTDPSEDAASTYTMLDGWRLDAGRQLKSWQAADVAASNGRSMDEAEVPCVRILIGCHPHNAKRYTAECERTLISLAGDPRTAAIGEIGLDYHYDLSPRSTQRDVFRRQIQLAHRMGLPIALHLREAHDDGAAILREEGLPEVGAVLHCFNLDHETMLPFLEMGCFIAFGGPVTFKKCDDVREAASRVPSSRILTETDSPFMAPEPLRGTVCGPENTLFIAARLAEVRGEDATDFAASSYANARAVFDRAPSSWQLSKTDREAMCAAATGCVEPGFAAEVDAALADTSSA